VERIDHDLQRRVGDLQAAETGAQAALDAARGLAPITARRALQALGDLAIYTGDLDRAADRYRRAYDLSMQAGDWLDAAWDAGSARRIRRSLTGDAARKAR
jgi:hypothetical protein